MDTLTLIVKIGLYVLMAFTAIAAVCAVTLPNLFHAALALAGALIGVAGIFIALQADFLAVVQILIYVGAVMTLVVFAIMMTENITDKSVKQKNNLSIPALASVIILLMPLLGLINHTAWPIRSAQGNVHVTVMDLGKALMGSYVFPFEIISIVLIAVLIGAVIVARKDEAEK